MDTLPLACPFLPHLSRCPQSFPRSGWGARSSFRRGPPRGQWPHPAAQLAGGLSSKCVHVHMHLPMALLVSFCAATCCMTSLVLCAGRAIEQQLLQTSTPSELTHDYACHPCCMHFQNAHQHAPRIHAHMRARTHTHARTTALEPGQHDDAQEVAQVQAVRSGIKAAVHRHALVDHELLQLLTSDILNQPPLTQRAHHIWEWGRGRRHTCRFMTSRAMSKSGARGQTDGLISSSFLCICKAGTHICTHTA